MKKAIILLSLALLTSQEKKKEVHTAQSDINGSIQNLNTSNKSLTTDPFSNNNIDEYISAFNDHGPDYWNTWFYEPSEDVSDSFDAAFRMKIINTDYINDITAANNYPKQLLSEKSIDFQTQSRSDSKEINNDEVLKNNSSVEYRNKSDFIIFPNPVVSNLYIINRLNELIKMKVTDSNGRVIKTEISNSETYMIDVSNFSPGIYFLFLKTYRDSEIQKFIKE